MTGDLYGYCDGNPVNYVDPDGHLAELDDGVYVTPNKRLIRVYRAKQTGKKKISNSSGKIASVAQSTAEGVADAIIGDTVNKLSDYKISKTSIPSLGPAFTVTTLTARPIVKTIKFISKIGFLAAFSYGNDIYEDFKNYSGSDFWKAAAITSAGFAVGVGAGIVMSSFGLPITVSVLIGGITGVGVSIVVDKTKTVLLNN